MQLVIKTSTSQLNNFRLAIAIFVVITMFAILVARLSYLQIIHHDTFDLRAETNRTSLIPDPPLRGEIFDRNGITLATNTINYTLEILLAKVTNLEQTIENLKNIININDSDIKAFKRRKREAKRLEPVILRTNLSEQEMANFAANSYLFPGVELNARYFRQYPLLATASHIIGYMGRINQQDQEQLENNDKLDNYRGTDNIGKHGLEASYEDLLHGKAGIKTVEISASGRVIRELNTIPSLQGQDLHLTIDIKLQQLIEKLYGDHKGVAVVIDSTNGELLSLVSEPTFDPNLFVNGIDTESWRNLNESITRPMFNRALRGTYPPGSTYKPFMALAALETNSRTADTLINDPGYWEFGNRKYRSPGSIARGKINMTEAIVHSSNVYFYTLAYEMGVDKIHDFMYQLGFGQQTGIDLDGEINGLLPNKEWKAERYKGKKQANWMIGETIPLGIGQGYNSFTMLQLAQALSTITNYGIVRQPHLVKSAQNKNNLNTNSVILPKKSHQLILQKEHVQLVLDAMQQVNIRGSASRSFTNTPYSSGGKTGTAQVAGVPQGARYNEKLLQEYKKDHSLFIGFAPKEHPKYVVALVVENAGWGGRAAAPIARKIFDYLLVDKNPSNADK